MRAAVVVPTNRPERLRAFLTAWEPQFHRDDVRLIICEDAPERTADLVPDWAEHYAWQEIDLGRRQSACIPRRSGGIRSFGFYLAGKDESIDMVVSLDDDVLPVFTQDYHTTEMVPSTTFLADHWEELERPHCPRWFNTMEDDNLYPRGHPYAQRGSVKPMLNHGLWQGMPDIDAYTQMRIPGARNTDPFLPPSALVPPGMYYSNCGMNYAFRREVAKFCFFPPLPDGMKRWDDIWSGIIFKRIADLHGWVVTSGYPCVRHERASDPLNNLRQEMLGYGINERLWQVVDEVMAGSTPTNTYLTIAFQICHAFPELDGMRYAMCQWMELWE